MQCQIVEALMTAREIDFAALLFDDLKKRVMQKKRDVTVPYPRVLKKGYGLDHHGEHFGILAFLHVSKLGASV